TLVVNQLPSPTMIAPVEACDDDFDGIAVFDLTSDEISGAIINGETNFSLSFHETLAAAELGAPAIPDPASYNSGTTTIYVRATDTDPATSTECFRVITLDLVVNPIPEIALPIPDLTLCNDGSDQAIFDLTDNEANIIGLLDPTLYTLSYHESEMNAEDNMLPIGDPENYLVVAPGTTVWVRLEDNVTGCASVAPFEVVIAPIPVFTAPPATLEACDTEGVDVGTDVDGITLFDLTSLDDGITAGDVTLEVIYYESQADLDAGLAIPNPDMYVNTTTPQTIFIQISSTAAGMCMAQTTIDLVVNPLPFIAEPLPASVACDDDNDGFGVFNLQEYSDDILAGLTDVVLRFYETFDNAQNDNTAEQINITVPYDNITGMAELYILAENTVTGCTKIYSFELLVFPMPDLPLEIDDLRECDEDSDGFATFNLTSQEPAILVNIPVVDQGNFIVTYHNSEMDALDGVNAIPTPDMYVNQVAGMIETIYVRVETNDGTPNNCPSFIEFDIEVVTPPVINPTGADLNMTVCNDDGVDVDPLGTFEFDLTMFEDLITDGDDLLNVVYYASQADLDAGIAIANPEAYTNVINSQTIQFLVSPFDLPDCSSQGSFELEVLPLPSPQTPTEAVALCDDDQSGSDIDGIVEFDLTSTVAFITGGETVDINIFDSLANAEETPVNVANVVTTVGGGGEILYTNTTPGGQTLYARVDSTVSIIDGVACFVIVPFDVVVNPLPVLSQDTVFEYTFCEEFDGDDTMGDVDLTTLADDAGFLLAPQVTTDFDISYHETAVEAENNANPIDQSVLFTVTDGDEIFFRIENITTGCISLSSVIFTVETRPLANDVSDIVQCADDPGINGIPVQDASTFDLTQQNAVITGGEPSTSVVYYTSLEDAQNMENEIPNPSAYVNTSDPQTIYARAINTASMCESTAIIEFMIFVNPLPFTDLSDEGGEICVDEITGEALDPFIIDGSVEDPIDGVMYSYIWRRDGTEVSFESTVLVDQQGEYEVTITAGYPNGEPACTYVANTSYVAVSAPVFEAVVLESSFNPGGVYTVEVINVSGFNSTLEDYEFAIDDGPFQSSTIFTGVTPGTHTVFGRRITGECSISEVEIGIIDYPRFFTPNQDGFHDTWNIIGIGVAPNLNAQIYIFDRYGKLLKQLSPTSQGWDGTFNGQPMNSDDYWFRVNYTEPDGLGTQREFVGHFTLKR
uniref:T9SS type B sorting domain-containing protein n=4 Tax=uncultured Dokdonia sp. TaxID=575653 RepID=UPI002614AE7B